MQWDSPAPLPSCLLLLSCPGVKSTHTSSSYLVLTVLCSLCADGSIANNGCFVSGLGSISLFLEYLPPLGRMYVRSASQKFCRELGNAISFKQQCRDPPKVRCTVFGRCSTMAVLPNKEMWMWRQVWGCSSHLQELAFLSHTDTALSRKALDCCGKGKTVIKETLGWASDLSLLRQQSCIGVYFSFAAAGCRCSHFQLPANTLPSGQKPALFLIEDICHPEAALA